LQRRAGLVVAASAPRAALDVVVSVGMRLGPVWVQAPCRVLQVVAAARRHGFAYGTLAGHPERGEEAFVVGLDDTEAVRLQVTAFWRPATTTVHLLGPLARRLQHRVTEAYLRALS